MRVTSSWLTEGAGSVHQRPAPPAAGIHATTPADAAEHGHAPGPTEPPGQEAGRHPPTQPLREPLFRLRLASNGHSSCECISDDCLDLCVSNSQFSRCIQA